MKRSMLFYMALISVSSGLAQSKASLVSFSEIVESLPAMVRVEGGTFMMGTAEPVRAVEKRASPAHSVRLSTFMMAETLVTQKLWNLFIKDSGYTGYTYRHSYYGKLTDNIQGDDSPAVFLEWSEAVVFCNWLSVKAGLEPAYVIEGTLDPGLRGGIRVTWRRGADGYRLVTEAEWEYAVYERGASRDSLAALYGEAFKRKQESLKPSVNKGQRTISGVLAYPNWGISEWTWDEYTEYGSEPLENPTGASGLSSDGNSKVNRYFINTIFYNRLSSTKEGGEGEFIAIRLAQDID